MAHWRVDIFGKKLQHLGSVEAPDEKSAIAEAAKDFNITPARQNKLVVTEIVVEAKEPNKSPDRSRG